MSETDILDALPAGSQVGGYEIVRVLGHGGFGIVYEGLNRVTEQRAAIKEFFPARAGARRDDGSRMVFSQTHAEVITWALDAFKRTTTQLCRLRHPHICKVFDYLPANNTGYMAMEYLEGHDLGAWLQARPAPPSLDELRPILEPVLDALAYVHGQGLIHRDIKPDNIFLTAQGRPVLIDFGAISRDVSRATQLAGQPSGTVGIASPGYTAPDQITAKARPNPTTDIYSIGAVLYRALAGSRPADGAERTQAFLHEEEDPYQPLAANPPPGLSPETARLIDACLAFRRADRPASIAELRTRLGWAPGAPAPVPHGQTTLASPDPPPGRPRPGEPPSRPLSPARRLAPVLAGGAALIAVAGGAYLLGSYSGARVEPTPPGHVVAPPASAPASGDRKADAERQKQEAEQARVAALVSACDRAAADPGDRDRPSTVPGVEIERVDEAAAISACEAALAVAPNERRIIYQLGRAHIRADQYDRALDLYRRAADRGSAAAMSGLGELYEAGRPLPRDYAQARAWYEKAAAAGNSTAMVNLGALYAAGWGVPQDYAQARAWYERGAAGGNPTAMTQLGALYQYGRGVPQDHARARSWYERAAAAGEPHAQSWLDTLTAMETEARQRQTEAERQKQEAEQARVAELVSACDRAAAFPLDRDRPGQVAGVEFDAINAPVAIAACEAAVAALPGERRLTYQLGRAYDKAGQHDRAQDLYRRAAEQGSAAAMNGLAASYKEGRGVPQDYARARSWFERAAASGNAGAMSNLGILYHQGLGVSQDYAQAHAWYERAAAAGDATAMRDLGYFYERGLGVAQNLTQARSWYEKAAAAGDEQARGDLNRLRSTNGRQR